MISPSHPMISRRSLLKIGAWSALAAPLYGQRILGANDTVRLGVIGCGSRAAPLTEQFSKVKNVTIAALCDADAARIDGLAAGLAKRGVDTGRVTKFQDYRRLLETPDIDAVIVTSPNHWHTLHAIHAMQAGKDVYVEKPVTHDLWEGQQLIAAERKYGRMLAAGLQSRSDPGPRDGFQFVREGNLGAIQRIHVCCFKDRKGIGKRETPLKPPASVDYNLWLGPAADLPLFREQFHYDWHWAWNTGNGDIGNQAPHEIDLANWLLGDGPPPAGIRSIGGRFAWDDAGETPNMQLAWYQLAGVPVIIEVNDLHLGPQRGAPAVRDGIRVGLVIHCEGGQLRGGLGGTYAVGKDGKKPIRKFPGNGGAGHAANFIDAVRSRRSQDIAAKVVPAERAAAIAHLANVSYRVGEIRAHTDLDEVIGDQPTVREILGDHAKQLADWGITKPEYRVGKSIAIDPAITRILTPGIDGQLVRRTCRDEFQVPELA